MEITLMSRTFEMDGDKAVLVNYKIDSKDLILLRNCDPLGLRI
jgi:hypothetical protein